jgi:hypothetical protein
MVLFPSNPVGALYHIKGPGKLVQQRRFRQVNEGLKSCPSANHPAWFAFLRLPVSSVTNFSKSHSVSTAKAFLVSMTVCTERIFGACPIEKGTSLIFAVLHGFSITEKAWDPQINSE